jgi:tetratricopeptide (TPR) repeat protein
MANKEQETEKIKIEEFDVDSFKNQATGLFEKYKNIIYGVLLGIVLLVGGLYAYFVLYKAPLEKKAEEEIFRAEYFFSLDSFDLALKGRNLPGQQGNFTGLLDFIPQYGGTYAGSRAYFMAGAALLHTGKYEESVKFLDGYSGSEPLIQSQVYAMQADAKSELNKIDEAFNLYMKAANHYPNKATSPVNLRKAALLMSDLKKNNAEALKIFEKIKKEYPQAAQRLSVDKDIARLGGK